MEHCKEANKNEAIVSEDNNQNDTEEILKQPEELADILNHFRNNNSDVSKNHDSFYIDANDIRAKNYNLSYNEYNLFRGQEKTIHLSESTPHEKKEALINLKKQTLFPAAEKLPEPKKSYRKKIILTACLSIIVLGIGFGVYWFLYFKNDFFNLKKQVGSNPSAVVDSAKSVTPSVTPSDTVSLLNSKLNGKISDSANSNYKYTVSSRKAYFYLTPDSSTRRDLYLNNFVRPILIPEKEKNGFIYVVYINKRGQSTSGWLNKKDLKPLP
jgi:hypothetical protein